MKIEDDIKILKGYRQRLEASCSNQLDADKEAFDVAINALETGEIYMTGKDYDLFLEGYKQGKKDFARPKGEWITTRTLKHDGNPYCSNCDEETIIRYNFCPNCGASMRDKKNEHL